MIRLTTFERRVRLELMGRARTADPASPEPRCIGYGELGLAVDPDGVSHHPMTRPPFRGLNHALGHVSMYESEHGRPLLSALVVNRESQEPGPGFAELARHLGRELDDPAAFWRSELAAVVTFWSDDDPTRMLDAVLERIVAELATVKERLRRLA